MPPKGRAREAAESSTLLAARSAFDRRQWTDAFTRYATADSSVALAPDDLERFANAAFLLARAPQCWELAERAHQAYLASGDIERAAWCAYWLGYAYIVSNEPSLGMGWVARARRVLDDANCDCAVRGYLLVPPAIQLARSGRVAEALPEFERAIQIGMQFGDVTLVAFARHCVGRVLVRLGRLTEGFALIDEVLVAVTSEPMVPVAVGGIYCSVIEACHEVFDLERAQAWTDALERWCNAQPDIVAFHGHCLIRRSEAKQIHGQWTDALEEACRARDCLSRAPDRVLLGAANYRCAELHRVRGNFDEAEAEYRAASDAGRQPHPGLALLWFARGQITAAVAAVRRLIAENSPMAPRARILQAAVDVLLAANDAESGRSAAEELATIAEMLGTHYVRAVAAHAMGAVLLAEGKPVDALELLRRAQRLWIDVDAPFDAARTRFLISRAHRALGDSATADLELDACRRVLRELGAIAELSALERGNGSEAAPVVSPLTEREVEVVRLIATGKTNRAIASTLGISEKTVARHVSNIFSKLDLPSRAAATAYAYEQRILEPARP